MTFQAKDVMSAASTILQDAGTIRWTPPELLGYLNEGVRQIVTVKPNAASNTVTLALVSGALQALPAQYTMLSRVTRNTTSGKPIRVLDRMEILDSMIPGWMNSANLAFNVDAQYVIHDLTNPRRFYVAPGNNGAGSIEAVVGIMPADIAVGSSPLDTDSYTTAVALPDLYRNCLVDFILYRAFSKDAAMQGAAARATAHKQLFDAALLSIGNSENAMSLASFGKGAGA